VFCILASFEADCLSSQRRFRTR